MMQVMLLSISSYFPSDPYHTDAQNCSDSCLMIDDCEASVFLSNGICIPLQTEQYKFGVNEDPNFIQSFYKNCTDNYCKFCLKIVQSFCF